METIELNLDAPASIHLRELADSTSNLYKLLRPWCFSEQTNPAIFKPIRLQALSYVQAIDFSITAAQNGFNFCEDVIAFAELLESSDEMQRQQYLKGLVGLAQEAENNASKAKAKFRNVRSIVSKLVQDAQRPKTANISPTSSNEQQLKELEQSVSVLERFSTCISAYISWWTTVHMIHKAQTTRQKSVVFKYNSIRNHDVLKKWKELRQEYVVYTYEIQLIQDANPDFELLLNKARLEDLTPRVQSPQSNWDDSSRGTLDAESASLKVYTGDNAPTWASQISTDKSSYESRRYQHVDPSAMLFAPIAFVTRSSPNKSSTIGRRDRILHAFGYKRRQ